MSRAVKRTFSEMEASGVFSPVSFEVGDSDHIVSEEFRNRSPSVSRLYFSPISSGSDNNRSASDNQGCQRDSPKGVASVSDRVFEIPNSKKPYQRTNVSICTSSLFRSAGSDSEDDEELCKILEESNLNS